ncbi:MAG: Holliday junction resolvase RuvX [Candidatus Izemoplasmatales bacterium]|jgi:putative Holliday junction resolvase|nr:Holliday junction resolvase RuvX [Candidatus Izemoplasmatales bacterium]MDD3865360.1 Holliday junction resolvase RuvX [Candidatus Izemoplasmatales bacterium]
MRILGLDLGSKTLGIALSDPSAILACGMETFQFPENNFSLPLDYIIRFIDNNKVDAVVLGYPKNMDGSIGSQGHVSEDFRDALQKKISIPITLWDERLTSRIVNRAMISADVSRKKRKENVDRLAATVILQSYLDSRK